MTKTYELPHNKTIMADVDEEHHTATVSVYALDDIVKAVNKTGYWIKEFNYISGEVRFTCSLCGQHQLFETDFCPSCGEKMVEIPTGSEKER